MKRKMIIILLVVAAMATYLAGCSGEEDQKAKEPEKQIEGAANDNGDKDKKDDTEKTDMEEKENELEWMVKTNTGYDINGKITGKTEYEYDKSGNILKIETTGSDDEYKTTIIYEYNTENRVIARKCINDFYKDEMTIEWENDGRNLVGIVYKNNDQTLEKVKEEYDTDGNLMRLLYYNTEGEVVRTTEYDEEGRLISSGTESNHNWEAYYEQNRYIHITRFNNYSLWDICELNEKGWIIARYNYKTETNATEENLPEPYRYEKYEYEDDGSIRRGTQYDENGTVIGSLIAEMVQLPKARPQIIR